MIYLTFNLVFAMGMLGLGTPSLLRFAYLFLIGFMLLIPISLFLDRGVYPKKAYLTIRFILLYFMDLTHSCLRIAADVVTVKSLSHPGFIEVPLEARTDAEIALVANLVTFSPGTMVVDLTDDRKTMLVHSMFLEDEKRAIDEIKTRVEARVLEIMR